VGLAATVWSIWKEWNSRIFQLKETNKIEVSRKLQEDIRIIMQSSTWKVNGNAKELEVLENWDLLSCNHVLAL